MTWLNVLDETGVPYDRGAVLAMNEANQIKVTDDLLSGMMKFITDKYNQIDFGEIEKSVGDIRRFKYYSMLMENIDTLTNIYTSSSDAGAKKYIEVLTAMRAILNFLEDNRTMVSTLYKQGNGLVQITYTSLVSSCVCALGVLVNNTIRFVTTEKDTDCEVLFDEIPSTIKNIHIKNITNAANNLDTIYKVLTYFSTKKGNQLTNESVSLAAVVGGIAAGIGIIILITKLVVLIREIIYSIYHLRVKMSDMIKVQMYLLQTNIESLTSNGKNVKVIARQKKILGLLEGLLKKISVKVDSVNSLVTNEINSENNKLHIDRNSIVAQGADNINSSILL